MADMEINPRERETKPDINTEFFSTENVPDEKAAGEISTLFLNNYPEIYPDELRRYDFSRNDTPKKIIEQVKNGNFFITALVGKKMAGMIKFRQESRTEKPDCEEWLGSWVMVDKTYRKYGVAEKLFESMMETLRRIKTISGKRMDFVADVHKDNVASISLCKKMGCVAEAGKSEEYLLLRKEVAEYR